MTYVITAACIGTTDQSCVAVCPVDCIYEISAPESVDDVLMLVVDPGECIDCGSCEPACPVNAIYYEDDLPDTMVAFARLGVLHQSKTSDCDGPAPSERSKKTDIGQVALELVSVADD